MLKVFSFISICLICSVLEAQVNTDSLKSIIDNSLNDTTKVLLLEELILELSYGSKEEARILHREALLLAKERNHLFR